MGKNTFWGSVIPLLSICSFDPLVSLALGYFYVHLLDLAFPPTSYLLPFMIPLASMITSSSPLNTLISSSSKVHPQICCLPSLSPDLLCSCLRTVSGPYLSPFICCHFWSFSKATSATAVFWNSCCCAIAPSSPLPFLSLPSLPSRLVIVCCWVGEGAIPCLWLPILLS